MANWRLVRLKQEQLEVLDRQMPGLPRWKQLDRIYKASIFAFDRAVFGLPKSENVRKVGKRGELQNVLLMGVACFVIALVLIMCTYAFGMFAQKWSDMPVSQLSKDIMSSVITRYVQYFDWVLLVVLVAIFLAELLTSLLIVMHPAFAILHFLGLIIITFVLAVLSNAFQDVVALPELAATAAQFPLTNLIMGWLPMIVFFFGCASAAVMFKLRSVVMA